VKSITGSHTLIANVTEFLPYIPYLLTNFNTIRNRIFPRNFVEHFGQMKFGELKDFLYSMA
jgi:hypothetical protein